jgi:hypothetical protein
MPFANVYPQYVRKAERKSRTQAEIDQIIYWLTGYDQLGLKSQLDQLSSVSAFIDQAPAWNPHTSLIAGVVCGVRVETVADPMMQKIR